MDWVAVYGAVLATVLAVWEIYKYRQDRPQLRVEALIAGLKIRFVVPGESVEWKDQYLQTGNPPFLAVKIANVGRHPVTVRRVGTRGGVDFSIKYEYAELPQALQPDVLMEVAGPPDLVDDSLERLGVWDPTGRKWLINRKQLKALKKQAREPLQR